jgi:hypothetical protein
VLSAQKPKLFCTSCTMLCTTAAEFGASGTFAGSGVFHGPLGENPLSGRIALAHCTWWGRLIAAAGAIEAVSATAAANAIHPRRGLRRMPHTPSLPPPQVTVSMHLLIFARSSSR